MPKSPVWETGLTAKLELVESYRAKAGRYAIRSLYSGNIDGPEKSLKAVLAARTRWRWLVGELREAEWPPAKSDLHEKYLRNCPMFGVTTAGKTKPPKSRACLRALYCPFCYAREYAVKAYDRLVPLLPAGKGERVLYGTEWVSPRLVPQDYATAAELYAAAAAVVNGPLRRSEVDAARPLGAVVFHRVRLGVFFNPALGYDQITSLTVVRTALMVVPKGKKLRVPGGIELTLTDDPGRRELAAEIGRLFRYPAEWYSAPVKVVAALGHYVAKARAFSAFGACRGAAEAETTEPTTTAAE